MTGDAVLFDMDGTLIDTPSGIFHVLTEVLESAVPPDVLRATIGRPLVTSVAGLLALPEDHARVARTVTRFRELFTELVVPNAPGLVFPGVPELLARLRARGRALAVVTSKGRRGAEELLGAAGLLGAFDTVVCHGMAARGKPHPDLARLAARELAVPDARCVVVGDAVDDIRMAVAAGMPAYGVSYGVATRDELRAAGAHRVAGSVDELAGALNESLCDQVMPK